GSISSFTYWQTLMNAQLARLELGFLPSGIYGYWCQTAARDRATSRHFDPVGDKQELDAIHTLTVPVQFDRDLVNYRLSMGRYLRVLWSLVVAVALVYCAIGGFQYVAHRT